MALVLNIGADNRQFNAALNQSVGSLGGFTQRVTASVGSILKFTAVSGLIIGLTRQMTNFANSIPSGLKNAFDLGGELSDISARTGIAAGDVMILRQAFKDAGVSEENLRNGINKMQKELVAASNGSASAQESFSALGLDLDALRSMDPKSQFEEIGRAINQLDDPAERASAAMKIFGKSGAEMLTVFSDSKGGLANASKTLGAQAEIMNRQSVTFDRISDLLNSAGSKLQGFFIGLADKVAPMLLPLLERFNSLDFSSWGQSIGNAVQLAVAAFSSGQLTKLILLGIQIALAEAVNFANRSVTAIIAAAGQYIVETIKNAITLFQIVTTREFWQGIGTALVGIFQGAMGFLQGMFVKILEGLRPVLDFFGQGGLLDAPLDLYRKSSQENLAASKSNMGQAADLLSGPVGVALGRIQEAGENIAGAFAKSFNKTGDLIAAGEYKEEIAGILGDLQNQVDTAVAAAAPAPPPVSFGGADEEGSTGGTRQGVLASSLARVGGGGGVAGEGVSLQKEGNRSLAGIVKNTGELIKRIEQSAGFGGATAKFA